MALEVFEVDPTLKGVEGQIWDRVKGYRYWKDELAQKEGGIEKFGEGYKIFGFNRSEGGYTYREWLPNAKQVFLVGEFNDWQNTRPLESEGFGRWSIFLPDNEDGSPALPHQTQLKVRLESNDGQWCDRVPAWTKLAWQDPNTNLFNGVFWEPPAEERYTFKFPRPTLTGNLKIYEAHVGMSSMDPKVSTYKEFADTVLPRIKRLGYNCVQLMAVAEHAHYGCFGYHVTSFFAPASRSGTPEELKYMVDTAHGLGIIVLMDLVHAHCSSNSLDGISMMDGTDYCYTHGGAKGYHEQWDSKVFHYMKHEVLRFLLSNVKWWIEEYGFDGYRFDGITSMLYHSHGIGKGYSGGYHEYFGPDADIETHIYLMLANDLIHTLHPGAVTVGEDVSGMPTLCLPVSSGGFGFDYRLAMAIPDMFIKLLKESPDDGWNMGHIVHTLTNRRWKEKCVAYAESHDQAIVGDKTLAFWLMDAEMYTGMSCVVSPTPSMCVDRGLSLHKMIRLVVFGLGGEAYLNFMGNEFGHPEWIDFPRPENGWSHHHCRRRWDLAEDDLLRYKFFQAFDELMQACENRYGWLGAEHQYVSSKNEGDKVIVFERGDLLFVFNFNPCRSFEDYQVGMMWDEPMRCILDTDESRFGGQDRLNYGHANAYSPCGGANNRPNSMKLYLPARTAQVLAPERLTQGGVRIRIDDSFLKHHGIESSKSVALQLETSKDGKVETQNLKFSSDNCVELASVSSATFVVIGPDGAKLACAASKDEYYRVYFPGDYSIAGLGYLRVNGGRGVHRVAGTAGVPTKAPAVTPGMAPVATPQAVVATPPESMPALAQKPAADPTAGDLQAAGSPATPKVQAPTTPKSENPAPESPVPKWGYPVAPAPEPAAPEVKAPATAEAEAQLREPDEMARCSSGLHFISVEELDRFVAGEAEEKLQRQVSEPMDELKARVKEFNKLTRSIGGSVDDFARSYKTYGLQPCGGDVWTYKEWIPGARAASLVGDFNSWDRNATPLKATEASPAIWSCRINADLGSKVVQGSKYKLFVEPIEGDPYYAMPAWSTRFVYTEETRLLDAVVWPLAEAAGPRPPAPPRGQGSERIYELHPGMARREGQTPSYKEAAASLPRIACNGYTAVLLTGVQECKDYADMGAQPVSYFAATRHLGTPEDFRALVDKAHTLGLRVYFSIAHDGAACCEDGLPAQFFRAGISGIHAMTGARVFNYEITEVIRYLLGSLAYWMEEFGVDGFRFQGVSSVIYSDGGRWSPTDSEELKEFFFKDDVTVSSAIQYFMLANSLVHKLQPSSTTIADERTMFPNVCDAVSKGGLGFDMRQKAETPALLEQLTKRRDEDWGMGELMEAIARPRTMRPGERILGFAESSEECIVARRPLKIAMLSWETLHTIAAGGVAPHVTELGDALHRAGHEVHIFSRSTNSTTWEHPVWGVMYHEVAFGGNSDFVCEIENMCHAFVGAVYQHEGAHGRFDIIHGHDWLVGPAIIKLVAEGKRCVFTMHSTETGRCGNVQYGGQSARVRAIEGHACHAAERVIAVSGVLKNEVCSEYAINPAKIEVVYNGIHADPIVNMKWQDEWTGNTKRDKGFDVMDPMFLFVGRLAVQKGPDLLLEAIPMVLNARGNAKFVIVGDGHMKSALQARANSSGIGHAVHFTGSLKSGSDHLKALLKSCDAVVVPSRNEPFGIVVLEAWAAGKPVVATTCGGPRDFVRQDREGFLVDPNPGSIAWGICKICENFEHARWMGTTGKTKALNEFNWAHIARTTVQIYHQQLGVHDAPLGRSRCAGMPLAAKFLGAKRDEMGVVTSDIIVNRGLALLKLVRLLATSLGSMATLTWMGNEFGQLDPLDLPRAANGFNQEKARVVYEMARNKGLKYKHLEFFELCMNRTEAAIGWLEALEHKTLVQDEQAKVLAYTRGGCLFAFNFHPVDCHRGYSLALPADAGVASELVVALDTDDPRFGGAGNKPNAMPAIKVARGKVTLTLPPRTALVLAPAESKPGLAADKVLQLRSADDLLDAMLGA